MKQNNKNMERMTLNNMANIHDHHPHAHFIKNNNGSLVLTLWKCWIEGTLSIFKTFFEENFQGRYFQTNLMYTLD